MKIALMTIWHVKNYGAELQTYATVKTLKEMGHDVRVIDYRLFQSPKRKSLIGRFLDFAHSISPQNIKFTRFWRKHIPSTKNYLSYNELINDVPDADLYLVGSDQVWNPEITNEKTLAYFLEFVPKEKAKASYASSFGKDKWEAEEALTQKVNTLLHSYKAVACREKQGVDILKEQFSINATHVLDPTLLHTGYEELTGKIKVRNTLVYYQLASTPALYSFAESKAKELGLTFIDVNKNTKLTSTFMWNRRSVEQWVKAIAESSFVITHSFHGVAMCLVHHRPFVAIYESGNKISRLASLLKIAGLENRLFTSIEEAETSGIWQEEINWNNVDSLLKVQRDISFEFLHNLTKE